VRVLDFGLAKFVGESSETERVMGTLAYVAPEQLRGKDIGPWTDLYALGLVILAMVTGRPSFSSDARCWSTRSSTRASTRCAGRSTSTSTRPASRFCASPRPTIAIAASPPLPTSGARIPRGIQADRDARPQSQAGAHP